MMKQAIRNFGILCLIGTIFCGCTEKKTVVFRAISFSMPEGYTLTTQDPESVYLNQKKVSHTITVSAVDENSLQYYSAGDDGRPFKDLQEYYDFMKATCSSEVKEASVADYPAVIDDEENHADFYNAYFITDREVYSVNMQAYMIGSVPDHLKEADRKTFEELLASMTAVSE